MSRVSIPNLLMQGIYSGEIQGFTILRHDDGTFYVGLICLCGSISFAEGDSVLTAFEQASKEFAEHGPEKEGLAN